MAGPGRPAFWRDIFPIFERLVGSQWVNNGFHVLFGPGSPGDLTARRPARPAGRPGASGPGPSGGGCSTGSATRRATRPARPAVQLPPFYGDGVRRLSTTRVAGSAGWPLTRTQYEWLRRWADGTSTPTRPRSSPDASSEDLPLAEQPAALDRAQPGGLPRRPVPSGIELTWTLRVASMWSGAVPAQPPAEGVEPQDDYGEVPARPDGRSAPGGVVEATGPGTLTRWMGVPWQTDEASCLAGYETGTYLPAPSFWAARVPNHVLSQRRPTSGSARRRCRPAQRLKHLDNRQAWLRFFGTVYRLRINDNVVRWYKLGIVAEQPGPADTAGGLLPERMWVETEVHPELLRNDATWEQLSMVEGLGAPTAFGAAPAAPPAAEAAPQEAPEGHGRRTLGRGEM